MDRISRCTPWNKKTYDPVKYRVVFASWSPIWIPFLESLISDPRYEVVGVLTMPDMPSGRGMKLQENVIATKAKELFVIPTKVEESFIDIDNISLDYAQDDVIKKPRSLRLDSKKYADEAQETYARLQSLDIDILYVIAYWNILPQHILDIPKIAPINIHGSLLPAYRGASPLQQVFVDGLAETGITLMKMEAGLDSGPMIDKQMFKLGFSDTVADLINRVKTYTPKWSLDSIDNYVHGELEEQSQDESQVTHCRKIIKEDGKIDYLHDTLAVVYRMYKGYYLWPKIHFHLQVKSEDYKVVIIEQLQLDEELYGQYKDQPLFLDTEYTLNPAVISLMIKPEWKKAMSWEDFKRGYL